MLKLAKFLWATFLITFPFSLRWVVYEPTSYHFGHFNPWVTGFFYLPELFLWAAFILALITTFRTNRAKSTLPITKDVTGKKYKWRLSLLTLALLFFVFNALFISTLKGDPILLFFFILRLLEAGMIWHLVRSGLFSFKQMIQYLLLGALFQMLLGSLQLLLNRSLGLQWLGEPVLSSQGYSVAKTDLAFEKRIRPYGTFLHPNILAAYLLAVFFLILPYLKKNARAFWSGLFLIMIFLTGSTAALIAALIGLILMFAFYWIKDFRKIRVMIFAASALFLGLNFWLFFNANSIQANDASGQERLMLIETANKMFFTHPWGVGMSQFTLNMELFADDKLLPWQFQPVHNVYFLILTELGVQGLLLMLLAITGIFLVTFYQKALSRKGKLDSFSKIPQFIPFLLILILAFFDHLLWDSFAGWILLILIISLHFNLLLPESGKKI